MIMTEDVPFPAGLHLKFSGAGTFAETAAIARKRFGASSARRNAMKPPREMPSERAAWVDADVADKRVGTPQESHVVDLPRPRRRRHVACVPITLVRIGIHDREAIFVGQTVESVPRLDSHLRAVLTRTVHHHDQRCTLRKSARHVEPISRASPPTSIVPLVSAPDSRGIAG